MLNTNKIEKLRKQNAFKQADLAKELNISTNTYQNLLKSGDFRASALLRMSELFKVSIGYLFDEVDENGLAVSDYMVKEPVAEYGLKKDNGYLKKRVKDLEKIISQQEKIIKMLEP